MRRRIGIVLVAAAVLVVLYAATVVAWRDPVTDLYARWKQRELAAELDDVFTQQSSLYVTARESIELASRSEPDGPSAAERLESSRMAVQKAANRYNRRLELGKPLGRIRIPRIGLDAVFVHGTRWGPDLSQGPGHYAETPLPGVGRTTAIAGHRTTFGAPFRHIDSLEAGDRIRITLPYAPFQYRVFKHRIVDNEDWSIIRDRGFDALVLSACHPLYSAEQRWVVFARLVRVDPVGGEPYALTRTGRAVPVPA
jgi:sortase A